MNKTTIMILARALFLALFLSHSLDPAVLRSSNHLENVLSNSLRSSERVHSAIIYLSPPGSPLQSARVLDSIKKKIDPLWKIERLDLFAIKIVYS